MRRSTTSLRAGKRLATFGLLVVNICKLSGALCAQTAANAQWTGLGSDNNMSNPANWLGGAVPVAGDSVAFDGLLRMTPNNDLASGVVLSGLTFASSAGTFDVGGTYGSTTSALRINGTVTDASRSTESVKITNAGSGPVTMDVAAAGRLTFYDSSDVSNLVKTGAGTLLMNYRNGGQMTIKQGLVVALGGAFSVGLDRSSSPSSSGLILDGGGLANNTTLNMVIAPSSRIALGNASGGFGELDYATYYGAISDNGGHGSLVTHSLTLGGANTFTGSTRVEGGTLFLDFSDQSYSPSSNVLYHGVTPGQLILGGVTTVPMRSGPWVSQLLFNPYHNSGAASQSFGGLTVAEGNSLIAPIRPNSTPMSLSLGGLSHDAGGYVEFELTTTSPTASNAYMTTTANTNGILGGWARASLGAVSGWAANDGNGNIVMYSSYTATGGSSTAPTLISDAASNVRVTSATTGAVRVAASGITDVNTIEITDTAARTIDVGAGNTLRLGASGAIWQSVRNASGMVTIGTAGSAGSLTAGGHDNQSGEIMIIGNMSYNSGFASSYLVNSAISDNGTGAVRVVVAMPAPVTSSGVNPTFTENLVTFTGNNTYSGGTWVNSGTLKIAAGGRLGSGRITILPGALVWFTGTSQSVANDFRLGGDLELDGALGTNASTLTLINNASLYPAVGGSPRLTVNSRVTGNYSLTLGLGGTYNFTNTANDFTGDLIISGAKLEIGASGNVLPHGAGAGNVVFQSTSTPSSMDLLGHDVTVNGLSSGSTVSKIITVTNSATGNGTATLTVGDGDATATFNGLLKDGQTAKLALTKTGAGTQVLGYSQMLGSWPVGNSYGGATTIVAGTLQAGGSGAFSPNSGMGVSSGATLRLNGYSNPIGSLAGGGVVSNESATAATLTLGADNTNANFSGALQNGLGGGALSVTKIGTGTQTLSGTNTYTGPTIVTGGTLLLTGSLTSDVTVNEGAHFINNSATPYTGALTIAAGAGAKTILSGSGTIGASIALASTGSTLSPGNSPGILTFTTGQTWNSFTYDWETNHFTATSPGTDFDQIVINSTLTLTGGVGSYRLNVLSLTAANSAGDVPAFSETAQTWQILATTGGITGFDANNWTVDTSGFTTGGGYAGSFALEKVGKNLMLTYTPVPVPEPGGTAVLGSALLMLLLRRRR